MTKIISRQQTKPQPSELSTMGVLIPPFPLESVNTKEVEEQPSIPSAEPENMVNITKISTANTFSRISSEEIAATLFKSTLLTLLAARKVKRGRDRDGNIVIVLPRQQWNEEMRLR